MILSIIIPVYNVERYVERCVESCYNQDIEESEYEIIIINDGSTDKSLDIINNIVLNHNNTIVKNQSNAGLSIARNNGMKLARGEYLMFVDSDDWIADNCLGKIVTLLRSDKPDCLAICNAEEINGCVQRVVSHKGKRPMVGKDYQATMPAHCAQFTIWNKAFLEKYDLSFMPGIFHEDSEFTPRAYYYAQKVSFLDDIIYFTTMNPNSIMHTINSKKSFDYVDKVCVSLHHFTESVVEKDYKRVYYHLISMCYNNALIPTYLFSKEDIKLLNKTIYQKKYLIKDLEKSCILKYRIESILLKIWPRNAVQIYNILQFVPRLFNKNKAT